MPVGTSFLDADAHPREVAQVFDLFAVRVPHSELKLARLQAIAKEHNVTWDSASFASSILPAPPDLIDVECARRRFPQRLAFAQPAPFLICLAPATVMSAV